MNQNSRAQNLLLPDILEKFGEWDDARGISSTPSKVQYRKLLEEILELGRALHSDLNDDEFFNEIAEQISTLKADGKMKMHPLGQFIGIRDGIGDSLKAMTTIANGNYTNLETCARYSLGEIYGRTGKKNEDGLWVKDK